MASAVVSTLFGRGPYFCSIYLARDQQRHVANSLRPSISIARHQASLRPMLSRSHLSCSVQVVCGCPRGRFQLASETLSQRTPSAVHRASCVAPRRHAGHILEEDKSPASNPRLHILQTSAILYLCVRYIVEPANSEYTAQTPHMEGLLAVDICLKQGA